MAVRQALRAAQAALVITTRDRAALGLSRVDTRLVATYQPHRMREVGKAEPCEEQGSAAVGGTGVAGGGGSAPLGLSEAANPQNASRRYGMNGLTANGARNIQRACCLMQDQKARSVFWTITLPDAVADEFLASDRWHLFQSRVRDLLVRALKAAGLDPHVVAVVELHPKRSMRCRKPIPHIHVAFINKKRDHGPYVLSTDQLDRLVVDACRYAGGPSFDPKASGNVQPIRKNVGAYMGKYMVKNRNLSNGWSPGDLPPRVWWFWSGALRQLVLELITDLPWGFIQWLHRREPQELVALGLFRQRLQLADPRAPATWVLSWRSPAALEGCVACWVASRMERETFCFRFS